MTAVAGNGAVHVEQVMGMAVSFDLADDPDDRTTAGLVAAVDWLHHVDRTFSPYLDDSTISRFGRGDITIDEVGDEVCDVLVACDRLRDETGGAFDPFAVPAPNGTLFDPSGYVKGWAVERAAEILVGHGARNFLVNAGGDIAIRGRPQGADRWAVGIRHPDDAQALAAVLDVGGPIAVATSATYERGAHIVDPRDGAPVIGPASVTVVGPDLGLADAYATALFVMGVEGLDWLADRAGYDGFVITRDDRTFATAGFARHRRTARVPG